MAEGDDDNASKTEEPTSKRLGTAREEGKIAQSQEVKTAAMLLAMVVFVWIIAPPVMNRVKNHLSGYLAHFDMIHVGNENELFHLIRGLLTNVGMIMLVPFLFLLVTGFASAIAQTGWIVIFDRIIPDINRLNPLDKFGKMFSMPSVVGSLRNFGKLLAVIMVSYFVLEPELIKVELLATMSMEALLVYLQQIMLRLLFAVTLVEIVIAGADWFYQRFSFMQNMRMTRYEVKEEHKQSEGDPMIKSRLRSLRLQRARQRMIAAVPRADVVITNPVHFACALKYDIETMNAPTMIAKGQDLMALRIRQIAEENGVPVVENPPLARALYASVEIDSEIPDEYYRAVAEVISYVFRLKGKKIRK